jgi:16S rRNA (uracil1498-N3)-methyltransferase
VPARWPAPGSTDPEAVQRFFLPVSETGGDVLTLTEREAHHALNVVRLRPGEMVMVLNGAGERLTCRTIELARRAVRLQVTERVAMDSRNWPLTLIQAMPKGKAFDTIVQKATELGAARILPLVTERVVAQIEPERHAGKIEHWRAIAIESIKQCGSPWLPEIAPPMGLSACLERMNSERPVVRLVASLRSNAQHPWDALRAALPRGAKSGAVEIWVGPEGDFTEAELNAIEGAGVRPMTLGPLVLRADTAAIYCLSVVNCALAQANPPGGQWFAAP